MIQPRRDAPGVIWVAGVGASAGLGAAVARRFAQAGFTAVVSGRTAAKLENVAEEIRAAGGGVHVVPVDVAQEAEVVAAAARVAEIGPLRAAVFNAGTMVAVPSLELSGSEFEQTLRINTLGGFLFGREALRSLVESGQGTLIFTGATGSLRGKPPFAAFAAAKAGLRSVSQTFAREFGPKGVHVAHVVIDGVIDGERVRRGAPDWLAKLGPDGSLQPDAIAEVYYQLHLQHRSAWTHELDLRPYKESF
jgi:NAD(P)-dependent dehydrogenase (short-subunit alcohol dehydrogenase family)